MANLDLKKTLKHLYKPTNKNVTTVDVAPMQYLMIDGEGNPNTSERYEQAVQTLYKVSYTIRALCKSEGQVFTVMPLEGLWEIDRTPSADLKLTDKDKEEFVWTMMILQPDFVSDAHFNRAVESIRASKDAPALIDEIRLETYHEGTTAQIMHIGSYDDESPNIARIHDFIEESGFTVCGKHHEIYLSDPRKVAPEKLKTIIRQPYKKS